MSNNMETKKRTHDESENGNERNLQSQLSDKNGDEGDQEEPPTDIPDENPAVPTKKPMVFTPWVFRQSLSSIYANANVKQFVMLCKEAVPEVDYAMQYLDAGGNCLELINILGTADYRNVPFATPIFEALNIILLKILSKTPNHVPSAVEACRHLLNNYSNTIHVMLSTNSKPKPRKAVLKLLTAIVTMSSVLAKEILVHINLDDTILDILIQHSMNTDGQSTVRTCFIHFLLSFLVDGTPSNIKTLLDKKGLLTCIFPDLIYDDAETVNLVLSTIRENVLEKSEISKTLKLHTFSTPILKNLVNLYNWKGRKHYRLKVRKKIDASQESCIDPSQKEIVLESVHAFLLILCTSHKYGVIFRDPSLGMSGKKYNSLILTVLESLERPWEHKFASKLVLEIAKTCPDVIKVIFASLENYIVPRVSVKWLNVVMFLKELFTITASSLTPKHLKELDTNQFFPLIQTVSIPGMIVKPYSLANFFLHENMYVRAMNIDLCVCMLNNLERLMGTVEKCLSEQNYDMLAMQISSYLMQYLPNASAFMDTWNNEQESDTADCDGHDIFAENLKNTHIKILFMDLIIVYLKISPFALEDVQTYFDPARLLSCVDNYDSKIKNAIVIKALELFLRLMRPFSPKTPYFAEYLKILFTRIDESTLKWLARIFELSEIFDSCPDEIAIWLEPLLFFDVRPCALLTLALQRTFDNLPDYKRKITEIDADILVAPSEADNIFEMLEFATPHNKMLLQTNNVKLCPFVYTVIELLGNRKLFTPTKNDWAYFSAVLIDLFHFQTNPSYLVIILSEQELNKKYCEDVFQYLDGWKNNKPIPYITDDHIHCISSRISQMILTDSNYDISSTLMLSQVDNNIPNPVCLKIQDVDYYIQSKFKMCYNLNACRLVIFHFTHLACSNKLSERRTEKCQQAIIYLFEIMSQLPNMHNNHSFLGLIYLHPIIRLFFAPLCKPKEKFKNLVTTFVLNITKYLLTKLSAMEIQSYLLPCKEKYMFGFLSAMKKLSTIIPTADQAQVAMELLEILELSVEECYNLVIQLSDRVMETFITDDNTLSVFGKTLAFCMRRFSEGYTSEHSVLLDDFPTEKIKLLYVELASLRSGSINLDVLTASILSLIKQFPHIYQEINCVLFNTIIKRSVISPIDAKLAIYLLHENRKLVKYVLTNFQTILPKKDLLFPLLPLLTKIDKFNDSKLDDIFKEYEQLINKAIDKPQKVGIVVRENHEVIVELIEKCMPVKNCEKIAGKFLKFDTGEEFHLAILEAVFAKAWMRSESEVYIINFVQTFLHMIVNLLKRDETQKLINACGRLSFVIKNLPNEATMVLPKLQTSGVWNSFMKLSLKYGLKSPFNSEVTKPETILHTFVVLCVKVFSEEELSPNTCVAIETLNEMILSHSEFLNVILGDSNQKTELLKLLLILSKSCKQLMMMKLVPVLLGAYHGTANLDDRLILALLSLYESSNLSLYDFRPYIWGECAVNYFSVRQNIETALWRQPSVGQVMDLLNASTVVNTIANFDLKRSFVTSDEYRLDMVYADEDLPLGLNFIPTQNDIIDQPKLKHNAKKKSDVSDKVTAGSCYDPCFYLPLFSHLLSPESEVKCYKFTQSGGLSLTLLGLASHCELVRKATYNVLGRFYFHLDASSGFKDKKIWIELINTIRRGLLTICPEMDGALVPIPMISAVFLARAALIMTEPLNPMYAAVNNFLFVKPSLNFAIVPELLQLFHSPDVNHKIHRNWILQVIRDGFRTKLDLNIMLRSVAFKMMLDFYSCSAADNDTKLLILQVINQSICVHKCAKYLLSTYALVSWINGVVMHLSGHDNERLIIHCIIDIIDRLWLIFSCEPSFAKVRRTESNVMSHNLTAIILNLCEILSPTTPTDVYLQLIKTLTYMCRNVPLVVPKERIICVIRLSCKIAGENNCEYILNYRPKCITGVEPSLTDKVEAINGYTRMLTLLWLQSNEPP